jgi:hypothetical protein
MRGGQLGELLWRQQGCWASGWAAGTAEGWAKGWSRAWDACNQVWAGRVPPGFVLNASTPEIIGELEPMVKNKATSHEHGAILGAPNSRTVSKVAWVAWDGMTVLGKHAVSGSASYLEARARGATAASTRPGSAKRGTTAFACTGLRFQKDSCCHITDVEPCSRTSGPHTVFTEGRWFACQQAKQ